MEIKTIDLYEYFNIERPENANGYLTAYILDVSERVNLNRKFPSILILPGGAYSGVSFRESEGVALKYLQKGYNAFVLKYSVSPCRFPTAFQEASMAMAYIRENAEELHVNKDCVCAIGFSAGGHLLGCITTMYNRSELDFLGDRKSFVKPDASLFIYPVISGTYKAHSSSFIRLLGEDVSVEKLEEFSIDKNVDENSPPAFIVSTFGDQSVSCTHSLLLASAYAKHGVPFSLHIFEKGVHGLSICEKTVYEDKLFEEIIATTSTDFPKWVDLSLNWLSDRGFKII
ncbi:MAG: alpha/beta hydrolase [Clostridia bacterium]|nr:alpha/beta hydrolase [Clostridia bacterium]